MYALESLSYRALVQPGSWGLKKIPAIHLKQSMDCKLRTSGVWGEAPAANDICAFFFIKKEAFGAIYICM